MMSIQELTLYSGDVPLIGQTQAIFDANTSTILTYLSNFAPNLNSRTEEINSAVTSINANATSASNSASESASSALMASSSANFKGDWVSNTTYSIGESVYTNSAFYVCKTANSDSSFDSAKWQINVPLGAVGNINNTLYHAPLRNELGKDMTYTCASGSTYIDMYGNMKTVLDDVPRYNENGIFIEPSSTNYMLQSAKVLDAEYSNGSGAQITEDYDSIDGGTNAGLLSPSDDGDDSFYVYKSNTFSVGDIITVSCFVDISKMTSGTITRLYAHKDITNTDTNSNIGIYADGTIIINDYDNNLINYDIELIKGTTYRMQLTFEVGDSNGDGSDVSSVFYYLIWVVGTTDLGDGVIFSFPQIEKSMVATSFIPTTDSELTRAKGYLSLTRNNNFPLWSKPLSIHFVVNINQGSGLNDIIFKDSETLANGYVNFSTSDTIIFKVLDGASATSDVLEDGTYKIVCTSDGSITSLYIDNVLVATGSVGSGAEVFADTLKLSDSMSSKIKDFSISDICLSHTESILS